MKEFGRSMVEMLGVLAIVGILSIGGIAGYTLAMNKHKANTILDGVLKRAVVASQQRLANQPINLSSFYTGTQDKIDNTYLVESAEVADEPSFALIVSDIPEAVCNIIMDNPIDFATDEYVGDEEETCTADNRITFVFADDLSATDTDMGDIEPEEDEDVSECIQTLIDIGVPESDLEGKGKTVIVASDTLRLSSDTDLSKCHLKLTAPETTIYGSGDSIVSNLEAESIYLILLTIKGNVTAKYIGITDGKIEGNVTADDITINVATILSGNITAKEFMIMSGCDISGGRITANQLTFSNNAVTSGTIIANDIIITGGLCWDFDDCNVKVYYCMATEDGAAPSPESKFYQKRPESECGK